MRTRECPIFVLRPNDPGTRFTAPFQHQYESLAHNNPLAQHGPATGRRQHLPGSTGPLA